MEVWISPVGCIIQRLIVPGRKGALADVVLGFDNVSSYLVSCRTPLSQWPAPCMQAHVLLKRLVAVAGVEKPQWRHCLAAARSAVQVP